MTPQEHTTPPPIESLRAEIPEGKTCGHCRNYAVCCTLLRQPEDTTQCYFCPGRYVAQAEHPVGAGIELFDLAEAKKNHKLVGMLGGYRTKGGNPLPAALR